MIIINFKKCTLIVIIVLLILLYDSPIYADDINDRLPENDFKQTAIIFISSATATTTDNFIEIKIIIDPKKQAINAVGIFLQFSKDKLRVKKLVRKNSFCDLFVAEKFNNDTGEINVSCGKPYPGINKLSEIMTVVFEKKQIGLAQLIFTDKSVVLANDGFGTNVLKEMKGKTIMIN
jgi:hypothetical protein